MTSPAAMVVSWLTPRLSGVKVASDVPSSRPPKFVRVVLAGGSPVRDVVFDNALISWEVWAPTELEAQELAYQVRDDLNDMVGETVLGRFVHTASCDAPRSFRDESSPRCVGMFSLTVNKL